MLQLYLKKMLSLLCLVSFVSVCEASDFKFSLTRTADWQYVGRCIKYTVKMTIPETTQLKTKIKLPINSTAILRLKKAKITYVSTQLSFTHNTTNLTSSANDGVIDIVLFDFNTVTRAAYENETYIKIEFEVQVMNHEQIVNAGLQWVSVGSEYTNQSVWAAMLAVKTLKLACKRPVLKVDLWGHLNGHTVLSGNQISVRLRVSHSCLTTDVVESGTVTLPLPPFLTYHSLTTLSESVSVVVSNTARTVSFKFGKLAFPQKVDLKINVNLDPGRTRADGKIHDCTVHVNLKYNGSADTCTTPSGSREFGHEGPASASFKYYVKQASCDEPLGMEDGNIADSQITASSYSPGGEPHNARLNNDNKAWTPSGQLSTDRSQFLEVNLTSKFEVRRLSIKGHDKSYVTRFTVYFSDDGVRYNPYKLGGKIKEFPANTNAGYVQMITFPTPIEAKFIRINPVGWHNSIALKVEFYGCKLIQQPSSSDILKFTTRGYMLDKATDTMYVCSVPMKRRKSASKCYYSKNKGATWTEMDNRLLCILGFDKIKNTVFGVSLNGKAVLKSTEKHSDRFNAVSQDEWVQVAGKDTTIPAVMLGSNLAITDTTLTPQAEHTVTADIGTEWGASASGIHVKEGSTWKLKAIWNCFGYDGYIDIHICSGGFHDPSNANCLGNAASIKVDGVERALNQIAYNVVVLTQHGNLIDSRSFDTHGSSTADDDMGVFIDGLPDNVIVLMAVADEATAGNYSILSEEDMKGADVQLLRLGAPNPRPPGYRASWALVGYKGPRVDWIRHAQALAGQGPSEISVQIPKITNGCK